MQSQKLQTIGNELGSLTKHLGGAGFEQALADFMGTLLPHDLMSVARYSYTAPPVMIAYSAEMPQTIVDSYARLYREIDPYSLYWRDNPEVDIITLSELSTGRRKVDRYVREFLFNNGIKDEIGLFLPRFAGSGLGFFYESATRRYGPRHRSLLASLYPLIANLYRAHLRTLFAAPPEDIEASPATLDIMSVTDADGAILWSTPMWTGLPAAIRAQQREAASSPHGEGSTNHRVSPSQALVSEKLSNDPHRVVWTLTQSAATEANEGMFDQPNLPFEEPLTPRERDIVKLILKGYPTLSIAGRLGLTRGTVKNHRRRIYGKLDITTERELFLMYIEAAIGPRHDTN